MKSFYEQEDECSLVFLNLVRADIYLLSKISVFFGNYISVGQKATL